MRFVVTALLAFAFLFPVLRAAPSGTPAQRLASLSLNLAAPAVAQQRRKRRSLLRSLFGRRDARPRRARKPARRAAPRKRRAKARAKPRRKKARVVRPRKRAAKPRKTRKRRATVRRRAAPAAAAAAVAAATPTDLEKQENASRVLVVGDFFAGGTADGLKARLSDAGDITVIERTSGSSGFIRDDYYDWPAELPKFVEQDKPDFIVFQIGSNDRQLLRTSGGKFKPRTDRWDATYKARIEEMALALKATGKPFLWVGVPPVRFGSMNRDFLVFNEWYKAAAEAAGGQFVDVWDGFTDADGGYTRSGPNEQGQIVTLRAKDGINMTGRGKTKLAYYSEPIVRKALSGRAPGFLTELPNISFGEPKIAEQVYRPARTGRTVVVKLDDPSVYGTDGLAGGEVVTPAAAPEEVTAKPKPTGRADNFTWTQ